MRVFLRDHTIFEANLSFGEGTGLVPYLGSGKGWLNLTSVEWVGTRERLRHLALPTRHVALIASLGEDMPLMQVPPLARPVGIEVGLEGGIVMRALLRLMMQQRLSDFLEAAGEFIPLWTARLFPRDLPLGDVAANRKSIRSFRWLDESAGKRQEIDVD